MREIKVYISQRDFGRSKNIFIVLFENGKRFVAKPVKFEFKEFEEAADCKPTIALSDNMAEEFMKAFAESLDQEGIKTDNDFKIKGLLEAKEAHLKDMRALVFDERFK